MNRRGLAWSAGLCIVALAVLTTACGDDVGESNTQPSTVVAPAHPLAPADAAEIDQAKEEVRTYCMKVARGLGGGPGATPTDFERASDALDDLRELAERDPTGVASDGSTAGLALGDIAENLEGTNCDPRLVEQIDEALSSVPAE